MTTCLFCNSDEHVLNRCDSSILKRFELTCAFKSATIEDPIDFIDYLRINYSDNINLIKWFAIKRCRANNNSDYFTLITSYIFRKYKRNNMEHIVDVISSYPLITFSKDTSNENESVDCCICLDQSTDYIKLGCGHDFCANCIIHMLQIRKLTCALCRSPIQTIISHTDKTYNSLELICT